MQDHEATQIGIMLGMAVSKRGTMDENVFRMLYVHIPTLHPTNYPDLEVSSSVQTAAMMGIGLLYQVYLVLTSRARAHVSCSCLVLLYGDDGHRPPLPGISRETPTRT
jgi:hypothetical protein